MRSLTAPDSAGYGVVPVIDPTDGPFANAGAVFGAFTSLPMLKPTVQIAPVFYRQGLLYEDQERQDSSGTTGRNGLPICNNATDPGWLDRLSAQDVIGLVVEAVSRLVADGTLNEGEGNAFVAKLDAAIASLDRGNVNGACGQLGAVVNHMNALIESQRLTFFQALAIHDLTLATSKRLGATKRRIH